MKALYIPVAVLAAILLLCLGTGSYINTCTEGWLDGLDKTSELIEKELWNDAQTQLLSVHRDWEHRQAVFHLFLEHQDLDEAEILFSGAIAACHERDSVEMRIHLKQLSTQMVFLAETQAVSFQNIL